LYSVTVDIVFTGCVVHYYVKAFRWVGKCNFGVMGGPEDEGGELGAVQIRRVETQRRESALRLRQ